MALPQPGDLGGGRLIDSDDLARMRFYWLVVAVLAVWRLTHLLQAEDGPWDLVLRLRSRAGHGFWGGLMDCFHCLSLWIAAPFAYLLGETAGERWLLWPAISGGAILVERLTARRPADPNHEMVLYSEEEEDDHGMLRRPSAELPPLERQSSAARPSETEGWSS